MICCIWSIEKDVNSAYQLILVFIIFSLSLSLLPSKYRIVLPTVKLASMLQSIYNVFRLDAFGGFSATYYKRDRQFLWRLVCFLAHQVSSEKAGT